jgi:cytochrome P450
MPFVKACIEEALRLYPPAASLTRSPVKDDVLAGANVPKGSLVVVSPWVVGRHRMLWRDPDLFLPERFLPPARDNIDRFATLAFGSGPRVCIGQRFAMLESALVLAAWLSRFGLRVPSGLDVRPRQMVTVRPWPGLPMTVVKS